MRTDLHIDEHKKHLLNEKLLEIVFGSARHGIQVLEAVRDEKKKIIDFRFLLSDKVSSEAVDANPLLLTKYPEQRNGELFTYLQYLMEKGEMIDETIHYAREGVNSWFRLRAHKFDGHLLVSREDLTAGKEAEERLMQLNRELFAKNRELETISSELKTFSSIAANDYKDTLANLYTSLEYIISHDARNLSDSGKANLRRAQAAIQKMKLLTDDIIAFSRIHPDEAPTIVDLENILKGILHVMQQKIHENNAVIKFQDLPSVSGYPLLISLLFTHLIDNAIKFRKEELHPVITITHKLVDGEAIAHSAALKDMRYHQISVIDNGIGFPAQEGEKIFTMFYRLNEKNKYKGSGVGLAICKKIMDLHGGFISSECTPECTTFRCFFPVKNR